MGVYTMMDDSEQEFFRSLVYRHWRLFDGKLRSVHGVELSFAFPGVKPIAMHPHRWSPVKREAAQKLIEGFVKDGIMSPVQSEWGFPGVLAPKPGNDPPYRLCIDLRKLNEICPKDTYEPPSCDDCLAWLADRPFRTTMDARWGFHQLNLSEETRKVFTLVTSFGTYCYNRLVMGWVNATAEFQRHMNVTIGDALWRCAIVMVDDICVASATMDDHKAHLEEVFSRLASRGHSLKPSKVKLLQEEVEYLGHISTPQGIKITPGQRDAIIKMPYPLNSEGEVDETRLRSFIGLANFSRRYIDNFAMHAYLLNGLLRKESPGIWTLAHAIAYDAIKYDIAWSKGLYQIDYKLPIFVCTDACKDGIGGYIYQKLPGSDDERVVLYFSRSTADAEKQWDTRELELLAAIATMEQFQYYLDGQRFTLETDHNNLRWIMNIKNPQGRLARWITRLTAFDVEFVYRKGECNEVADCVSRNALAARLARLMVIKQGGAFSGFDSAARQQTLSRIRDLQKAKTGDSAAQRHVEFKQLASQSKGDVGLFEVTLHHTVARTEGEEVEVGENEKENDQFLECPPCDEGAEIKRALRWSSEPLDVPAEQRAVNLSREAIRRAQESDEICRLIKKELSGETVGNLQLSRGYVMEEGVICKVSGEGGKEVTRPLAPRALRSFIMRNYHASIWACHRGTHATNDEIAKRFFWPKMREDINNFVSTCKVCQMAKALKPSNVGWLRGRRHSQAMNELCIDLIGPIGGSTNRHVKHAKPLHILVALDPFTHMVWLEPLFSKGGGRGYGGICQKNIIGRRGATHHTL